MKRRATLPGAAELFRTTGRAAEQERSQSGSAPEADQGPDGRGRSDGQGRSGSGRRRHDAKITVYVSDEELLALEQTRLALRAEHGLAADRGRVVREAVAVLLADFEAQGADSVLVRRLRQERGE
ncbi:MAG: hypothetical protein IJH84_09285 [Saccharopolyspora sp.]|uniref:hypothetical protein n=1 Tax=Saccharopolyspora TaxID=1835 RepID=UPI00190BA354|nr:MULTISPECIES: hypothetical protein [unclassified Saccharopolyspora]MBK0870322.1 hypothetical protein [Saccharopolyspora sp. HNM0986]MBQ6641215.1 hypothetical protein [Saccharopolyspora sp.]